MIFSSVLFLFYFLPIILIVYFAVKKELRNAVLLMASIFFYAWGEPSFVIVLIISILVNYITGIVIDYLREKSGLAVKGVLGFAIIANLGILFYYKYIDFCIINLNRIFNYIGIELQLSPVSVALPIGLSFFTFQGLSYVVDVYQKAVPVQRNPFYIALYISMFPQLIAGPIVRYGDIYKNISDRTTTLEDFEAGEKRFIIGLSKKVVIADTMATTADRVFQTSPGQLTPAIAWLGAVCFTFQIFFDFSGYSDMAIGLGRIFGFHFMENFNLPYISTSLTEFWRRWHISLSTWFRDYLYIPLGGNRKGNVYLHLVAVFICTGLWHGAAWTFLFWGLWHGIFLVIERIASKRGHRLTLPKCVKWMYTMFVVIIGWVIFRSNGLSYAANFLHTMAGYSTGEFKWYGVSYYINMRGIITLTIAGLISMGIPQYLAKLLGGYKVSKITSYLKVPVLWLIFLFSICMIVNGNYSPFIYFRF